MKMFLINVCIVLLISGTIANSNAQFGKPAVAGEAISGVQLTTDKANQSQVVWHDGKWWGVFRDASDGIWYVYKYSSGIWTKGTSLTVSGSDQTDVNVDNSNDKMYVLFSDNNQFCRLTYSSGSWSLDSGHPKSVSIGIGGADPACITRAIDGDLFIFFSKSSQLKCFYSSDNGDSWGTEITVKSLNYSSVLTDAISFTYSSNDYVGVFVGEGGSNNNFYFLRLDDNDTPSVVGNWVEESMPVHATGIADDHVNIVKDSNNNLYMIGKTGTEDPNFYLFKRTNSGTWSEFRVDSKTGNDTRPALALDESNNNLIVLATVDSKIQYAARAKDNLSNIGTSDWQVALENGTDNFNNVTVSYQILNSSSNLLVCAENNTQSEVWYSLINVGDIALPVFISEFQAQSEFDQIKLEWVTYSEVDNLEWIIYRKMEGESFREIARLPGQGSSNISTYYQFIDQDVELEKTYYYQLANVDFDGQINYYTETVKISVTPLHTFNLFTNYPNPFNSETNISFQLNENKKVKLTIYDLTGKLINRFFEGFLEAGYYKFKWDGRNDQNIPVPSGVYFLHLKSSGFEKTVKMTLSN